MLHVAFGRLFPFDVKGRKQLEEKTRFPTGCQPCPKCTSCKREGYSLHACCGNPEVYLLRLLKGAALLFQQSARGNLGHL